MARTKPREAESVSRGDSISEHANDWIQRFLKQLEDSFIDAGRAIPADAPVRDYQDATIRAMFRVFLDSGMDSESVVETVGQVSIEGCPGSTEWNSELNQRRFKLIDKEIQETLTPAERVELAGLTRIMREQLDSEANLPMEGAKALHRKLLKLAVKGKPS